MTSDEALMLEYQGGSRAAFEELFARQRKPLYGFFGRRLNNRERAEDLVQETFLAVIRAASRYEPRASVRTYLYGIALKLLGAERRKLLISGASGRSVPEAKTDGTSGLGQGNSNAVRLRIPHRRRQVLGQVIQAVSSAGGSSRFRDVASTMRLT